MTAATKAPTVARLLPVALFTRAASKYGIRESERTLILTGRLTRVTVGRRAFYPWADVVAAMPDWARDNHAAIQVEPVATGEHRSKLLGRTVTVERATRLVAKQAGVEYGAWVAVERFDGFLDGVHAVSHYEPPTTFARRLARKVGGTYVPDGSRR